MREYGILSPKFWIGKTGRALRKHPDAQRVALYLISAPTSEMTGVFYCPLSLVATDVGFYEAPSKGHQSPLDVASEALNVLVKLGFCVYDFESEWVFVTEMARWQIGDELKPSDKRVAGLKKFVHAMPDAVKLCFLKRYNDCYHLGYDLDECEESQEASMEHASPFEAPSKPHRSQEQEQEQDISSTVVNTPVEDSTPRAKKPSAGVKAQTFKLDVEELPDEWRQYCNAARPDLNPDKVFVNFKAYWTIGKGKGKLRSEKGWTQSWMTWCTKESERPTTSNMNLFASKGPKEPEQDFSLVDYGAAGAF